MNRMSDSDWSDLDARLLRLLVAIVETGSITGAAHTARRHPVGGRATLPASCARSSATPCSVKAGRGIVATVAARLLAHRARRPLAGARALRPFRDVRSGALADDLRHRRQRPAAGRAARRGSSPRLRQRAPGVTLRIIPSDAPTSRHAARGAMQPDHQPAAARRGGHHAEAPVRGPLSRLLRRRRGAPPPLHAGGIPRSGSCHRRLSAAAVARPRRASGRQGDQAPASS